MAPEFHLPAFDIDQALESCRSENALPAFDRTAAAFERNLGCSKLPAAKGNKFQARADAMT
eukprot:7530842-Pyramimonas_sp.AAC.1